MYAFNFTLEYDARNCILKRMIILRMEETMHKVKQAGTVLGSQPRLDLVRFDLEPN